MARYTILYVDDEPDLLVLGKTFLESIDDFAIDTRESAQEGLAALRAQAYDAVISDYLMPEMDGLEFLKAVRQEFGTLPFILFTGRGREAVVIEAINNGVDFYLQKGGDVKAQFAELAHKINMAVERKRAVDERFDSEKRLSSIFHASPIHQLISDFSTGRIIDINDRFLADLRMERVAVVGRTMEEIGLSMDPEQYSVVLEQLMRDGTVRNAELLIRAENGKVYTTLASLTRVQAHGQDLIYTQSVDITAQKKAQQMINALLNAPPDVSMLLDTAGNILAVNNAASRRYGITVEKLIGLNAYTLRTPDFTDLLKENAAEVLQLKKPLTYIDDRSGRAYENHLYPLIDSVNNVSAVAVYSHDITEERLAKEALRQSEEKYRLVVEHSHDSIYIYRDDHFLFINRQAEELSGYTHEELMQRDIWDVLHPDDRAPLKERALKRFAGGHVSSYFEARILRKDGSVREGEFYVDLITYLGKPAILGIARDITEKKRNEEAIKEREHQLRSLADNLPNGMVFQIMAEPDGSRRFLHVSAGVEKLHEVTVEEVLRNPLLLYNQMPEYVRVPFKEAEDRAMAEHSSFSFEIPIRTPSGRERWLLIRSAPRTLQSGKVIWDGIELDITAARRSEEELKAAYEQLAASQEELRGQFDALRVGQELLQESEEKYRTLVEQTDDGIFVAQDKKIVFVNRMLAERMGYTPEELTGNPFEQIIAPEDREMVMARHMTRLTGNRLPADYEFELLHKDGIRRSRVRIRVGSGTYQGKPAVIGTLHDVTEERRQQEALAQSEELYRKTVAAVPDVIVRADLEGKILFINDKGAALYGEQDPAALIGRSVFSFFAPECLPLALENTRRMFAAPLGPVEYVFITQKSGRVALEVNGDVLRNPDGEPYGFVFICRDITERQQAEEALRQSEELYRTLITASPDGIAMQDLRGVLTYVSPRALAMFGLSEPAEAVGTPVIDWIAEHDRSIARERMMDVYENGVLVNNIYRMVRKDGSSFDVEMHSALLYDCKGGVRGIVSILRDITERRLAENALRDSEERYRRIIEEMQDVYYRTDNNGIITMISKYGAHLVGYDSAEEIIGKYRAVDFYYDAEERDNLIAKLYEADIVSGYPLKLKDRFGKLHYATASSRLIRDNKGNITGIEGILHDITAIKNVENALRQANRQLTLMTSITRHDIRNQLLALNGWIELSRASVDDPDRMLDLISKEQHIAEIIREQIDSTTIVDDMGVRPPEWQDPAALIQKAEKTLPFGEVGLQIEMPAVEIFADHLLGKVFYNLLDNSLRYGGESLSLVRVSAREVETGMVITIEDNGTGISQKDKERVFERGFGKNTGLGLFLASEILGITDLSIRETGSPGKGARFEIAVPPGRYRYRTS